MRGLKFFNIKKFEQYFKIDLVVEDGCYILFRNSKFEIQYVFNALEYLTEEWDYFSFRVNGTKPPCERVDMWGLFERNNIDPEFLLKKNWEVLAGRTKEHIFTASLFMVDEKP